jgi:hypothetical protein
MFTLYTREKKIVVNMPMLFLNIQQTYFCVNHNHVQEESYSEVAFDPFIVSLLNSL